MKQLVTQSGVTAVHSRATDIDTFRSLIVALRAFAPRVSPLPFVQPPPIAEVIQPKIIDAIDTEMKESNLGKRQSRGDTEVTDQRDTTQILHSNAIDEEMNEDEYKNAQMEEEEELETPTKRMRMSQPTI